MAVELGEHVVGAFRKMSTAADAVVGAAAARIERRARQGEDLAALLEREARNERARAERWAGLSERGGIAPPTCSAAPSSGNRVWRSFKGFVNL